MVNDKQQDQVSLNEEKQAGALQGQIYNMLSGVERSLAVTCESIMDKMKQLEQKMDDMEKRCLELAKDTEKVLKESITDSSGGEIKEQTNEKKD